MKIKIIGHVWKSNMNGAVYDVGGLAPCITCGQHAGVEPKIMEIRYEKTLHKCSSNWKKNGI